VTCPPGIITQGRGHHSRHVMWRTRVQKPSSNRKCFWKKPVIMTYIVTYWYRFTMIHYSKFNHRVPQFTPPPKKKCLYFQNHHDSDFSDISTESRTPWEVFAPWPGRWWLQARWPLKWTHDITSVSSIVATGCWWTHPEQSDDSRNSQRAWAMAPGPTLLPVGAHFGAFKRRIPLLWAHP